MTSYAVIKFDLSKELYQSSIMEMKEAVVAIFREYIPPGLEEIKSAQTWITKRQDSRFMAYFHVRHPGAEDRAIALSCTIVDGHRPPAG